MGRDGQGHAKTAGHLEVQRQKPTRAQKGLDFPGPEKKVWKGRDAMTS
jgi:hypothetical protein